MPRVVMIPTARFTFATDTARQLTEAARGLAADLGAEVTGPPGLVMSEMDVAAAAGYLDRDADLVINVCATFADATPALRLYRNLGRPVLLWAFREPGAAGDRLWLNSLCGAVLFAHAIVRGGGEARLLYGDPGEPEVRDALRAALAGRLPEAVPAADPGRPRGSAATARAALASLRDKTIGLIGDPPAGYTPSEYDPRLLTRLFGLRIRQRTVEETFWQVRDAAPAARDAEQAAACAAQPSLCALDPEQVSLSAGVTTGLRDWVESEKLDAVTMRCWPEFPVQLGVAPCSALSRLADAGIPTACERDVYGITTMLLLEALGSGPTYLVDTPVDLDAEASLVRLWHCGSAATSLAADPAAATQSVHCNRKIGVAGDFALKTGRVVIARLAEDGAGLRLLIASGESLPEPNRFQGNTAAIRLDTPAGQFARAMVSGGFPHHTVLAWTDVRPQLRAAADLLGIGVREW
ncbi:MAG: hypothetical protein LBI49_02590 [Nocardiopsaceae bacterium]|jgi:L-fucose isomerase-like protein|nr:hypothetical protein [Nocardiopsaceae bacterium]